MHDVLRNSKLLCGHVSAVGWPLLRRVAHSDATQNVLTVFLIADSRAFAEYAPAGEKGRTVVLFGVKACWATSLYARMHSSTVIPNLPSMIAMILCSKVLLSKKHEIKTLLGLTLRCLCHR